MKKIKITLATVLLTLFGVLFVVPVSQVGAQGALEDVCNKTQATSSAICDEKDADIGGVIEVVINTLLFLVAAIAVIMIIIGGIRYATSGGNASTVTAAKNTILYAVIGLVVAILAYAIVKWVMISI